MQKVIWACWLQGRQTAPPLVTRCLQIWEERNPSWRLHCLDLTTIGQYVDLSSYVDLRRQSLTAASLSDIFRIQLLYEYGGVWVDATTLCNVPLDEWLSPAAQSGFFAFSGHAGSSYELLLGSWFMAAEA